MLRLEEARRVPGLSDTLDEVCVPIHDRGPGKVSPGSGLSVPTRLG